MHDRHPRGERRQRGVDSSLNILHILDERWDSGLTAYGLAAARSLQDRGHRVRVAARPGAPAFAAAQNLGIPVFALPSPIGLRGLVLRDAVDVVNAHTGAGHTRGFLATRFTRAALVRTRAETRRLALRPGQGFLFRRTDGVIAASRVLGGDYENAFPFLRGRLRVVPPGVAPTAPAPEPAGPVRVGLLARLDPVKGHRYFIEAAALLKDRFPTAEFLAAGEEKNTRFRELREAAARRGLADRLRFLGRVPDAVEFIRSCHIGVVASVDSEAVSRAALEWMAQGRPLVATTVGALPEIILTGDNGYLVPPKSAPELARALGALLEDPVLRYGMGEKARRTVESRFSMGRLGEDTEAVFADALHRRGGRR